MRFLKMFCMLALIAMMSAVAVKADSAPADPTLVIHKPGDPPCPPPSGATYTCFSENSAEDPIFIADVNKPGEFVWDGQGTLLDLFADFLKGPIGTPYSCFAVDVFNTLACNPFSSPDFNGMETLGFEFHGEATPTMPENGLPPCDPTTGNCSGVSMTLMAPEPNSMLLLVSLGLPAIGFAKKRWNARPSA